MQQPEHMEELYLRMFIEDTDIPTDENDPFWKLMRNPNLKGLINILLIKQARQSDPDKLSDAQCRSRLAILHSYSNLLQTPDVLIQGLKDHEKQMKEEKERKENPDPFN
jgi:hypothetical protein